ncbi:biopolymer transporter ExbD [Novimethylophilus kurashikiensis]|uniref:Biopolymer transporter ExbD n=1 Tax=Novimethylophilus kurashikiensis TaxID=1825523 RepID=A0A2R5F8B4_9PROT|nr:hypothetical protein [Novimethylophilus kurashikiensis]GBG14490.1 biopolymer transporter ExbD [Novimethylophilus kurashikiensis]
MNDSKIVYVFRNEADEPQFDEASHSGTFGDVLEAAKRLARTTAGFMFAQVLDHSGKVMANVCQEGVHLSKDA